MVGRRLAGGWQLQLPGRSYVHSTFSQVKVEPGVVSTSGCVLLFAPVAVAEPCLTLHDALPATFSSILANFIK